MASESKEPLPGASVYLPILGRGTVADDDGRFILSKLAPGHYSVEISLIGYVRARIENVRVFSDSTTELSVSLTATILPLGEEIIVVGKRPLVDVNEPSTQRIVRGADLEKTAVTDLPQVVMAQPGVTSVDREPHIRGGRTYETDYTVDGISVADPFLRQGMAVRVSPSALERLQVQTGGIDPGAGSGSAGVVTVETRDPDTRLSGALGYTTDLLSPQKEGDWNSDRVQLTVSGPLSAVGLPHLSDDPRLEPGFVLDLGGAFTDTHLGSGNPNSSVWGGSRWAPRSDNRYNALAKLVWRVNPRHRLVLLFTDETNIDQDRGVLDTRIRTATYSYGWPLAYARHLSGYNTFTRQANSQIVRWEFRPGQITTLTLTGSRVFSRLHSDVNGKAPDEYVPPQDTGPTIIEASPDSSYFTIRSGDGFYDAGDGDLWYDHYIESFTLRADAEITPRPNWTITAGAQGTPQRMQVIDIFRPWMGLDGLNVDRYRVYPTLGAGWLQNRVNLRGAVIDLGLRGELWWPGKYVEDAVADTTTPNITPAMRERFERETFDLLGRKARGWVLPRVGVSFALTPSASVFASYDRLAQRPNPRFVYAKLTTRSPATFQLFGNPALDPERTTALEGGVRWLWGTDWALTVSAYQRDVRDYISAIVVIPDPDHPENFWYAYANRDLAQSKGIELTADGRAGTTFRTAAMVAFAKITGEHSSPEDVWRGRVSREGEVLLNEVRLDWDKPWRMSVSANWSFGPDDQPRLLGINLWRHWNLHLSFSAEAGKRYTPYTDSAGFENERIYYRNGEPNSKLGPDWSSLDISWEKYFTIGKSTLALIVEGTNIFNHRNYTLINPVTGRGYERGEPIPTGDNFFETAPSGYNLPIWDDPSRYERPVHWQMGVRWMF